MHQDIDKILVDKDAIARRVQTLGDQIAADLERDLRNEAAREGRAYDPDHPDASGIVIIPILTGAFIFTADLVRCLSFKLSIGLAAVSSYPGKSVESKGVRIDRELPHDLGGKHVLVIDDILDSGQTLAVVKDLILKQNPASVRLCVLLRKPENRRVAHVDAEYVGFEIPDEFVVGYGLDYDGYYRNYPAIAVLKKDAL
jgi:hypoxanthine phosphoribosyltransferase